MKGKGGDAKWVKRAGVAGGGGVGWRLGAPASASDGAPAGRVVPVCREGAGQGGHTRLGPTIKRETDQEAGAGASGAPPPPPPSGSWPRQHPPSVDVDYQHDSGRGRRREWWGETGKGGPPQSPLRRDPAPRPSPPPPVRPAARGRPGVASVAAHGRTPHTSSHGTRHSARTPTHRREWQGAGRRGGGRAPALPPNARTATRGRRAGGWRTKIGGVTESALTRWRSSWSRRRSWWGEEGGGGGVAVGAADRHKGGVREADALMERRLERRGGRRPQPPRAVVVISCIRGV